MGKTGYIKESAQDILWRLEKECMDLREQRDRAISSNKKLRRKIKEYEEKENGIERCEGCNSKKITNHDVEGVPLCKECWDELVNTGRGW